MPVRVGEEVQEVLRRGDGELSLRARNQTNILNGTKFASILVDSLQPTTQPTTTVL